MCARCATRRKMQPIHVALLGCSIFKRQSEVLKSHWEGVHENVEGHKILEEWAYRALKMADSDAEAMRIVSLSICENYEHTALEIAMHGSTKHFLSHKSVEHLIGKMWRGKYGQASPLALEPGVSLTKRGCACYVVVERMGAFKMFKC